ncbi:MAG TPA: ABC transporter permease [Acidimicrobiales bacterium]|nr:ABC transporter permease [Acidimicrobiales bacterium]
MLLAAIRDLQWRRGRFAITVLGTALVFAMSLLMSGLSHSFTVEIDNTLDDQRATTWIAPASSNGAFSPGTFLTGPEVAAITAAAAPVEVAPLVFGTSTTREASGRVRNVNVMGVVPGGLGAPLEARDGSVDLAEGTVVVPPALGYDVGDVIRVGVADLEVIGVLERASLFAGTPTVTMSVEQAQRLLAGGNPVVSMVLADSADPTLPEGFRAFTRAEVEATIMRPLESPTQSIDFVKVLLWLVAALIVASVVYLTVLERTRDIAVFKATGASTAGVAAGICLQAVVLAVVASICAVAIGWLIAPLFPMDVVIPPTALRDLPILAVGVGLLSGLVGVRRSVRVDPAAAFGGP